MTTEDLIAKWRDDAKSYELDGQPFHPRADAKRKCADELEAVGRAAAPRAWISVDDRLPEAGSDKRKLVWLVDYDGMAWIGIRVHVTRNEWFNNNKPELATVTHWMDLPPRPIPASTGETPPRKDKPMVTVSRCQTQPISPLREALDCLEYGLAHPEDLDGQVGKAIALIKTYPQILGTSNSDPQEK